MHQPKKKQHDNTCYNFTLKCLAALSAAAVVAGAFIASAATHGAAAASAAITTNTLVATTVASAGVTALGLTLGGVALLIAGVCLIPYLICRSMGPSVYGYTAPSAVVSGPGIFGRGSRRFMPEEYIPVSAGGVYPSMPYVRPSTRGGDLFPMHHHGHQPGGLFPSNPHVHGHDARGPSTDGPSSHVHGHR